MDNTIQEILETHNRKLRQSVFASQEREKIFAQILSDKFSINDELQSNVNLDDTKSLKEIQTNIIQHKFEQRIWKGQEDILDKVIQFLTGEQQQLEEVSYTKQQQKQKLSSFNKNQDSDTMAIFDSHRQLALSITCDDYYKYTEDVKEDMIKMLLNFPIFQKPLIRIHYNFNNESQTINVYPTVQFLYSLYIDQTYIEKEVSDYVKSCEKIDIEKEFIKVYEQKIVKSNKMEEEGNKKITVQFKYIRQNPQFTLLYMGRNTYIIGMKNQFSKYDLAHYPLEKYIKYISDESCHILYNTVDEQSDLQNSPFGLNLYILMDQITKQELASNVVNSYFNHQDNLINNTMQYNKQQGDGYIAWRFIMRRKQSLILEKKKSSIGKELMLERKKSSAKKDDNI